MPMYNIEELKELINTIDNSSVTALELESPDGDKLAIKKKVYSAPVQPVAAGETSAAPATAQSYGVQEQPSEETASAKADKTINCPMVGVFYAASSPDAEPYVKVGSKVNAGDVVCIVEAMKLMNEITASESGTIAEICAENGQIVEFGQPLFKLS